MTTYRNLFRGFRFPAEVIEHAVWLSHCFSLSLRDVETILSSIFQVVTRMGHHAFLVELFDGGVNGAVQVGCIPERLMGQVAALEVAPGAFNGLIANDKFCLLIFAES